MAKIDRLIKQAKQKATVRGHKLGRFQHFKLHTGTAIGECKACHRHALVDVKDQVAIRGATQILDCPGGAR
jgi:hypothetical protein